MVKRTVCGDCKAYLTDEEMKYHPFEYCLIAKTYPEKWRKIVEVVGNVERKKKENERSKKRRKIGYFKEYHKKTYIKGRGE